MRPATHPRDNPLGERLLWIDPGPGERLKDGQGGRADGWLGERGGRKDARYGDARVGDLPAFLRAGDLLVVNDAATLPASLQARSPAGQAIEVRLLQEHEDGSWDVVLFGEGDWRTPTECRLAPPRLSPGDNIRFGQESGALSAMVEAVSGLSPRLLRLRFDRRDAALWTALYRIGHPVQYAYLTRPLDLWLVQTRYSSRPWAAEMPSAGRPLTWGLLLSLRRAGVDLAILTHAAGLSSTGDPALDAALPARERFDIPAATVAAVLARKPQLSPGGSESVAVVPGRVIAVGTTVVRALEGCIERHGGVLVAGRGETELRLHPRFRPRAVDGLLTGLHEPTASHFDLLQAFVPADLLTAAYAHAEAQGYQCHEFGDSSLILAA